MVLNLVTGIITARFLGPEGRGIFTAVTIYPQFLGTIAACGFPNAIIYFLKRKPEYKAQLITASLIISGVGGIATTLVGVISIPYFIRDATSETLLMTYYCSFWITFAVYGTVLRQIMIATDKFQLFNTSNLLFPCAYLLLLLVFLSFGSLTVWEAIISLTLPVGLSLIYMAVALRNELTIVFDNLKACVSEIIVWSLKASPMDLLGSFSGYIDRLFLVGFVSTVDLGIYAVVFNLSRVVLVLQAVVGVVVFPALSGRDAIEIKRLHDVVFRLLTYLTIGIVAICVSFGSSIVSLVYGKAFATEGLILDLLVLEAGVACLTHLGVVTFMASGRPLYASVTQAVGLVVACAALAVLVPLLGIVGAAWAFLLASLARLAVLVCGMPLVLKQKPPSIYPRFSDLQYVYGLLKKGS
jgi:O-antigen/teichoic acid export membrane protein